MPEVHLLTYLQNIQKMDKLQRVFYLKNTIIYKAIPKEQNIAMKKESVLVSTINSPELLLIRSIQRKEENRAPSISSALPAVPVTIARLKKRQTVRDYMNRNGWDESDYFAETSSNGLVKIFARN